MLRTVKLYGKLRKFGREFTFDINSPAEAIAALCSQVKGFEAFLRNAKRYGLEFAIFEGKKNITLEEAAMNSYEDKEIRIAPIIAGSKSGGLFTTILGVALIAASFFTGGTSTALGMGLLASGAGMALGGVAQLLAPSQKATTNKEQDGNNPSYAFGGAVTTTANGSSIGYLYGTREIGGTVISGGIYPEDII